MLDLVEMDGIGVLDLLDIDKIFGLGLVARWEGLED